MHRRFFRSASVGTLAAIVAACSAVQPPVAPTVGRFSQPWRALVGTGEAEWIALDRAAVQIDANAAALAAGATGYNRPEDVEIATSSGNSRDGANTLYVAVTGRSGPADNRVIAIDLHEPGGGGEHSTAFVYDYVRIGLNAPADFDMPDNVALSKSGDLFITEDPGGGSPTKTKGDDIWMASPGRAAHAPASSVVRFRDTHRLRRGADRHLLRHPGLGPVRKRSTPRRRRSGQGSADHARAAPLSSSATRRSYWTHSTSFVAPLLGMTKRL